MDSSELRFADSGETLSDFANHFMVRCPRCGERAEVTTGKRLICLSCHAVSEEGRWYGAAKATVSVKCRECHDPIWRQTEWDGQWSTLMVTCENCGDRCAYEAQITRQSFHEGLMTDPVFGLPLWLQKDFRGELFWAYNYRHLEWLRQYIAAKLRERGITPRNTIRKSSAMMSRLPAFIKKASNREALLHLTDQLLHS